MPVRIIVGAGTAAAVFLNTVGRDGYINHVIGSDGLWEQLPDHPMGQPSHLLQLPGQKVPSYQTATGRTGKGLGKFLTSHRYQAGVRAIVQGRAYRHYRTLRATRIRRSRNVIGKLVVELSNGEGWRADQVILATGIGPQRDPPPIEGDLQKISGHTPVIEGIQFLAREEEQTPRISRGVYGGGATAAWVTATALQTSRKLCWFDRKGGTEFSGSDLPWNAQVPDGIAMITASISALNSYIPIEQEARKRIGWKKGDWLDVRITKNTTNISLADRNQLAVLFTLMFDEWPATRINTLVERVVAWRSETEVEKESHMVFGITPTEFHVLVDAHGPEEMSERELQERFRLVGVEFSRKF